MKWDEPKTYRWTRDKYYKMAEVGILKPNERVELLEGEIFVKYPEPKPRRWTREEYYKMAALGWFDDKRVELIEGEVIEMSPQLSQHAAMVGVVADVLEEAFGEGYCARVQVPLDLGEASDPEPDVAIVAGRHEDYIDAHPTTALLIVEISDSTLSLDRNRKASLYAKAGIADYWIVNLIDRQLEVHRAPAPDTAQPYGFGYTNVTVLQRDDSISPLAAPPSTIAVADLLPKRRG